MIDYLINVDKNTLIEASPIARRGFLFVGFGGMTDRTDTADATGGLREG